MEKSDRIVLDFSKVGTIGQAFADEIFRVFKSGHPEIDVSYENAGENAEFMIKRALSSRSFLLDRVRPLF
jgi:hypothetical protein